MALTDFRDFRIHKEGKKVKAKKASKRRKLVFNQTVKHSDVHNEDGGQANIIDVVGDLGEQNIDSGVWLRLISWDENFHNEALQRGHPEVDSMLKAGKIKVTVEWEEK